MAIQNPKECIVCKRMQVVNNEGRIIDGTWFDDDRLPKEYFGKWVCCNHCYEKLVQEKRMNKHNNLTKVKE